MENMDDFTTEYVKPFVICFDLLNRSNLYILEKNAPFLKKNWRLFLLIPCIMTYHLSLVAHMWKVVSGGVDFLELANIVPSLFVGTHGILKSAIVVPNKAKIRVIIMQLGAMWRTTADLNNVQISKKTALMKRLNLCHTIFYWINIIGSWQYMLAPLFETLFRRYILQQQCELLLPFACRLPFDHSENWLIYIAVYIFQTYSMIHLIYIYLGAEFLMVTLCAHLSTEFTLLQDDLLHVRPTSNKNETSDVIDNRPKGGKGVNDVLKRHQILIMLSKQLDGIFNKMIFINLLFATITICFFGFVAKVARGPADMANNVVGVFASMLPIFNLCYYGQLLTDASAGIAESAYKNLWYKGDLKYQKMLYFILKRSQTPCCLTSMKYSPITLNTFTTVLSTTWSYFSLANSMYEKNDNISL